MSQSAYRAIVLSLLGIGLVMTGFAAYALILAAQNNTNVESTIDFSAIPAKVQKEAPALTLTDIHVEYRIPYPIIVGRSSWWIYGQRGVRLVRLKCLSFKPFTQIIKTKDLLL